MEPCHLKELRVSNLTDRSKWLQQNANFALTTGSSRSGFFVNGMDILDRRIMVLAGDEVATMLWTLRTCIPFDVVHLSGTHRWWNGNNGFDIENLHPFSYRTHLWITNTTGYWAISMVALYPEGSDHAKEPILPRDKKWGTFCADAQLTRMSL